MRVAFSAAVSCLVVLALAGCGTTAPVATNRQGPTPANQSATSSNAATTQSAHAPPVAASPKSSTPATSNVEPVDTSKYDAEIKRLEEKAKKGTGDQQTRVALGKAYANRGDALTGVRQYSAALGDYRRALRYDPNNEQARQMSGTIIRIYKSMGREVPPEGQEQPPVTLKQ